MLSEEQVGGTEVSLIEVGSKSKEKKENVGRVLEAVGKGQASNWKLQLGRGRAQGFVGFDLCTAACPLPNCGFNLGLCSGGLPPSRLRAQSSCIFARLLLRDREQPIVRKMRSNTR